MHTAAFRGLPSWGTMFAVRVLGIPPREYRQQLRINLVPTYRT